MDLDGDGNLDILTGAYSSHQRKTSAGLMEVFRGKGNGEFSRAQPVCDRDYEPLVIDPEAADGTTSQQLNVMLTRPFAADINADGMLDLIVGNFPGHFFLFQGLGNGEFETQSVQLLANGQPLQVEGKSDPFVIDWDQDGDLDIVSGSGSGGVYLSINSGSPTEPRFEPFSTLVEQSKFDSQLGLSGINGPCSSTRVCVDDFNKDGLLDLIVGDHCSYQVNGTGSQAQSAGSAKSTIQKLERASKELEDEIAAVEKELQALKASTDSEEEIRKKQARLLEKQLDLHDKHYANETETEKIQTMLSVGFVWVFYQRPPDGEQPDTAKNRNHRQSKTEKAETAATINPTEPLGFGGAGETSPTVSAVIENVQSNGNVAVELVLTIEIPFGHHIYGSANSSGPTTVAIDESNLIEFEPARIPRGIKTRNHDGVSGYWLTGTQQIRQRLEIEPSVDLNTATISGAVNYMLCNEKFCHPPASVPFEAKFSSQNAFVENQDK